MATWYWVATSPGYWHDPLNWAPSPLGGMPPTTVPGNGDVAVFGAYGPGDCHLGSTILLGELYISGYPGTLDFHGFSLGNAATRVNVISIQMASLSGLGGSTWYVSSLLSLVGASAIPLVLRAASTFTINKSLSSNGGNPAFQYCVLKNVSCPNVSQTADFCENQGSNSGISFTNEVTYLYQDCICSGILDVDFSIIDILFFVGGDITGSGTLDSIFDKILLFPVGGDEGLLGGTLDGGFYLVTVIG